MTVERFSDNVSEFQQRPGGYVGGGEPPRGGGSGRNRAGPPPILSQNKRKKNVNCLSLQLPQNQMNTRVQLWPAADIRNL